MMEIMTQAAITLRGRRRSSSIVIGLDVIVLGTPTLAADLPVRPPAPVVADYAWNGWYVAPTAL
ncbi:hypothetical protein [Bradyrhizobium sp. 164]|uniref:hypothetical protein n=1 Tax=Bradyrhizobium sp. 164 TaxID=2782637 RepID=UPI001FF712B2|nr:hypothetical protein [Bradyrhizobium sp. 164]